METKLIDFLQDVVFHGKRQKAKRREFRSDGSPYLLRASSIDQYVKAVMDLHGDKKSSTLQYPRGTLLKSYLRSLRLQEVGRIRSSFQECPALVLLMREGKTNQIGKTEYAATIRHKQCAFGGLAFYFFTCWHKSNEPFPNFENNSSWFDTEVFKSNKGGLFAEIDYKTQYNSICKAFDACGINSIKKTHAGRGCGARHAEIAGASEDQLRRHGRWNAQSMENNYLTSLPRQSIRVINGFPGAGGQFWLPRSSITPPESLMKKVFPLVDTILPLIESGYEDEANINNSSSGYPKTICGQGFLNLLKKMRCILLQDAVFLRVEYPQNSIFCNPIFQDPEFLQFESALLDICRNQDSPQEMKLKDVVPELELVIRNLSTKVDTVSALINTNATRQTTTGTCSANLEDIASMKNSLNNINVSFDQLKVACSYFANGSALPSSSITPTDLVQNENYMDVDRAVPSSLINTIVESTGIPQYKMQRRIKSVNDLWHEYSIGFKVGNVTYEPIEELEQKYKGGWHNSETERKMYSRRVVIIETVKRIAEENGGDILSAVAQVEARRQSQKWSLNKLNEELRK